MYKQLFTHEAKTEGPMPRNENRLLKKKKQKHTQHKTIFVQRFHSYIT